MNIIVATGRESTNLDSNTYRKHVKIVSYIPFTTLLPQLSATVFHGGFVTLLTMLNGGIPVIVFPLAADHFMNGGLVDAAQVGKTVQGEKISLELIRETLKDILANPLYKQNALRMQHDMQAMASVDDACDMLESLVQK